MSKQIIDWQKDSILAARGSGRGSKIQLDHVSFQSVGENAEGRTVSIEEALHSAVEEAGLRGDVTVVATREIVEVRTIQIPRVDASELPDIIRFQAQRQLSNMTDGWALDYVMLPPAPGQEMQTALVGGISPAHLAEIDRMCTGAGLTVGRVLLRPIEIARFAVESGSMPASGAAMIVCVSEQNADLLILRDGQVLQVRGTRLPHEEELVGNSLKGEIRRSLMAASPQLANVPLTSVLLVSTSKVAGQLDGVIAEASGASVTHLDPTTLLPSQLEIRDTLARQSAQRLAAIAGALNADQADKSKLVDFKNPKKRPPKKKNTGRILLYGGAAAALVLGAVGWWYSSLRKLDQEIAFYKAQIAEKADAVKWSETKVGELRDVQDFLAASPNWLDELTFISSRIPEAEKIILESPTFTATERGGAATIRVPVRADASNSIGAFEKSLRDENHVVQGSGTTELTDAKDRYKWRSEELITINGRGWNPFAISSSGATAEKEPSTIPEQTVAPDMVKEGTTEAVSAEDEAPAEAPAEAPVASETGGKPATSSESASTAAPASTASTPEEAAQEAAETTEQAADPTASAKDAGAETPIVGSVEVQP